MSSVRNTRTNKYNITIDMETKSSRLLLNNKKIPYPQSLSYFDTLTIHKNKIEIVANRSGIVDIPGIFLNHQSALYRQITKALAFYYCATQEPIQIKKITVIRLTKTTSEQEVFLKDSINQVVNENANLHELKNISLKALEFVFLENSKAHGFLFGLTFLIKSLHAESKHLAFENRWKAFNAIYKAVAGAKSDFDCHKFIRTDIVNNPESFPLLLSKVSVITAQELRSNTRWIKFIHNDFSTANKTESFKDFVLRNQDHRLVKVFKDTLSVRESYLKEQGFYDEVLDHLNKHKERVNDSHLAATLCIKYAYFARNKLVHAENIESGFRLFPLNKEQKELSWLSDILIFLIIDLINKSK